MIKTHIYSVLLVSAYLVEGLHTLALVLSSAHLACEPSEADGFGEAGTCLVLVGRFDFPDSGSISYSK